MKQINTITNAASAIVLAAITLMLMLIAPRAADFKTYGPAMAMDGTIVPGDVARFKLEFLRHKPRTLFIRSTGGHAIESLDLALAVRATGMTVVTATYCYSGCVTVWSLAASRGYLASSKIALHRVQSFTNDGVGAPVYSALDDPLTAETMRQMRNAGVPEAIVMKMLYGPLTSVTVADVAGWAFEYKP